MLALERMRILDMAHSWSKGTHSSYQGKLRAIRAFEILHELHILRPTPLDCPPHGPDIPLMWCQEAYSLRPGSTRRGDLVTVTFGTIRQLRSAVSQFYCWDALVAHPDRALLTQNKQLLYQPCRPTDNLSSQLHAVGMANRLGTETSPSIALLDRHVRYLDTHLNSQYLATHDLLSRRELALAGLCNLTFWLGWLRSQETFQLRWEDTHITYPGEGQSLDLPAPMGAIIFDLCPETKSNRSVTADVVIAFHTLSGLSMGKWLIRAWNIPYRHPYLFSYINGRPWDSDYFRRRHLYPSLEAQRQNGDVYLRAFDIPSQFWSLHSYRRGSHSHVTRGGIYGARRFRKASETQSYEHARWRRKRNGEAIDVIYRQWTILDRISITLYSM